MHLVAIICLVLQTGGKGRACRAKALNEMLSSDRVETEVFAVTNQQCLKGPFQVPQGVLPIRAEEADQCLSSPLWVCPQMTEMKTPPGIFMRGSPHGSRRA